MKFDLEDVKDWLGENSIKLLIGASFLVCVASLASGGMSNISRSLETQGKLASTANNQELAEQVFREKGCSSQVLSQKTRTANFVSGEVVIDPASITPDNQDGTPFNGGYVCSRDGSLFSVDDKGVTTLVGTSPVIRKALVATGAANESRKMQREARKDWLSGGDK